MTQRGRLRGAARGWSSNGGSSRADRVAVMWEVANEGETEHLGCNMYRRRVPGESRHYE